MIRTPEQQYLHELIESYVTPLRSEIKELRGRLNKQQVNALKTSTESVNCGCTKPNSEDKNGNEWCNKCFKVYKDTTIG